MLNKIRPISNIEIVIINVYPIKSIEYLAK